MTLVQPPVYTTFKINAEVQMDRIRQLRKERGLSQAKLAVRADMDPATLNRLERGTGNPNLKTLERVAEALGIEVVDLFPKEQPRLPELVPPGQAYFVPLEEGEEEDTVTLRLYTVRLMDERDRLLQEVRRLEREKAAMRQELEKSGRTRE